MDLLTFASRGERHSFMSTDKIRAVIVGIIVYHPNIKITLNKVLTLEYMDANHL